jgi:hypothetical protein
MTGVPLRPLSRRKSAIVLETQADHVKAFGKGINHPDRCNLTGFSMYEFSIGGKWVDLLKAAAPALARVAVMFNPETSVPVGNLRSKILMVQSAQNRHRQRATDGLNGTRDRRVLVQR